MKALPLLLALAWRNLWRNRRRTGVMLAAIVMGVWAMIFMNGLMRGMTDQMVRNGLNMLPGEAQLQHPDYTRDPSVANTLPAPDASLRAWLDSTPAIRAWAQRVQVPAVIASEYDTRGVLLLGVQPAREAAVGAPPGDLVAGRFLKDSDDAGLVIGQRLADRLDTEVGKRVVITSQDPDNELVERGIRVVGIYRARLQANEEAYVYTGLATAQTLLHLEDRVSQVALRGDDYRQVEPWLRELKGAVGDGVAVRSWSELDSFLGIMLSVQDGFALIFILVVFAVLSFGLVNTLAMAIFERIREIGLMQALGMAPRLIVGQVLLESLLLLSIGLALGCGLGVLTILSLRDGIDLSGVAAGMEMVSMGTTLTPALSLLDIGLSIVVVLGLGLLASLLPAWRAARLDPVQALAQTG